MSTCKQCGEPVRWEQKAGRWFCFNADGSDHWDLCSKTRWEQVKATGERFVRKDSSGYKNSVHGTKLDMQSAGWKRGANYKPTGFCLGCVPAWETCPNGCPDAFTA